MSQKVNSPLLSALLPRSDSLTPLKRNHPKKPAKSSTTSSPCPLRHPSPGTLTITIKYTCPHCLEAHSRAFPLSSSTKRRTYPPLTMRCSKNSQKLVLLQLVTLGRVSMVFVERYREG